MASPLISLVIPVLNEAAVLPQLIKRLELVLAEASFRH